PIDHVDGAAWQFLYYLSQDADALAHFLDSHQVPIVTVPSAADHHVEIVLLVIEVWMFTSQIVRDPAAAQIRPRNGISNDSLFRDHVNVLRSIDKNAITREQFIAPVQAWN